MEFELKTATNILLDKNVLSVLDQMFTGIRGHFLNWPKKGIFGIAETARDSRTEHRRTSTSAESKTISLKN